MFFRSGSEGDCGKKQLIKSYGSQFGCSVVNCSRHNNLTIPHGRLQKTLVKSTGI
jgi:hypothetical protein